MPVFLVALTFVIVDIVVYALVYVVHALTIVNTPLQSASASGGYAILGRVMYFGLPLELLAVWIIFMAEGAVTLLSASSSAIASLLVFVGVGAIFFGPEVFLYFQPVSSAGLDLGQGFVLVGSLVVAALVTGWLFAARGET